MNYVFSGNADDYVINAIDPAIVTVKLNGTELFTDTMTPVNGKISIKIGEIAESAINYILPTQPLTNRTIDEVSVIHGSTTQSYRVVKGGVDSDILDSELFMKNNFLTWQPQELESNVSSPRLISYAATQTSTLKAKFYHGINSTVVTLNEFSPGNLYIRSLSHSDLSNVNGININEVSALDVWVEVTGAAVSYTQRYVFTSGKKPDYDTFIYQNSLGGFDTVIMDGKRQDITESESVTFEMENTVNEYDIDVEGYFQKNSGYFYGENRVLLEEFLSSSQRFTLRNGAVKRIVLLEKSKVTFKELEYTSSTFKYCLSKKKIYQNNQRDEELSESIEFSFNGEAHQLAPRLYMYPKASVDDELIIPVQPPYGNSWKHLSASEFAAWISIKNERPEGYPPELHEHDDRYYTKEYLEGKLVDENTPIATNVIEAQTVNNCYHVKDYRVIISSDFYATGEAVPPPSPGGEVYAIIDDTVTVDYRTWSSARMATEFNRKVNSNDVRLYDARPASDVHEWAKQTTPPTPDLSGTVEATFDYADNGYHVKQDRIIYTSDFVATGVSATPTPPGGETYAIIDDTVVVSYRTWSSSRMVTEFNRKVNTDDARLYDARPASDVHDWAKQVSPPVVEITNSAKMVKSENIIRYGTNGLQYFNSYTIGNGLNGNTVATPYGENWSHNIIMTHPNPAGYYTQISTPFHTDDIKFRRMYAGAFGGWQTLYHSGNVNNYDTDWNCKELKTKGRASIGQQTNGTCIIDAYNGYAFYGCNNPENGIKIDTNGTTTTKNLIVNPVLSGSYNEGLRLVKHSNGWSNINFGTDTSDKGFISGQWVIGKGPENTFLITSVGNENGTNNLRIDSSGVAYCKDIIAIG